MHVLGVNSVLLLLIVRRAGSVWYRELVLWRVRNAAQVTATWHNFAEVHLRGEERRASVDERGISGTRMDAEESRLHGHSCHGIQCNISYDSLGCAQQSVGHGLAYRPETVLIGYLLCHSAS